MKTIFYFFITIFIMGLREGYAENNSIQFGAPVPDFTLADNMGNMISLSDFKGKYVVLEWINLDCPFVRKHYESKNMQRLQKLYTQKGVVWLSINSSAKGKQGHIVGDKLKKRLKDYGVSHNAYLFDTDGKIGKKYGAKTTPHIFILNPQGNLIYHGAIDDKPSTDLEDIENAKNYVITTLNSALSNREVTVKRTKSYGCSVKY